MNMKCDICQSVVEHLTDGPTSRGPWANMCDECFPVHGIGVGTRFPKAKKDHSLEDYSKLNFLEKSIAQGTPLSFEKWMSQVNKLVNEKYGVGLSDLPDVDFREGYDREYFPKQFVEEYMSEEALF